MKNIHYISFYAALLFCSCTSTSIPVETIGINGENVLVLNESKVKETRAVKLSELTDGYELIRFEKKDDAYFKYQWIYFSENYVCIRQSGGPIKLYDSKGRFIHDVGNIGHGHGEYISAYDVLIDEKDSCIYVTSITGNCVLRYDLQGRYVDEIKLGARANKACLYMPSDSVLSLVHICFAEGSDKFTAANISLTNIRDIRYTYNEALGVNSINEKKESVGFNYENFAYRNSDHFAFFITSSDTLYHYDEEEVRAVFTVKAEKDAPFLILNELPNHYLSNINGAIILTDKQTGESYHAEFINDYIGNMGIYPRIEDGYIFQNFDQTSLKEDLTERLEKGDYPEGQKDFLQDLVNSLDTTGNDILFRAKLKTQK